MRRILVVAVVIVAVTWFAGTIAQTAAPDAAERTAIQQVIRDQIPAFRRDDRAAAFALGSAGIQRAFGSPEAFMGMVRQGYRPVYRPRQVQFGEVVMRDWGSEKRGFVVGPYGQP